MSLRHEDVRARPDGRLSQREVRARLYGALRDLATKDAEVIALLDAYEAGYLRRDEAIASLGWTLPLFVNVRRRLDVAPQGAGQSARPQSKF